MSDEIGIPKASLPLSGPARTSFTHSYRARRTGMDGGTRRLIMAASALGLVLLAGMGAWMLTGRRSADVPTIEADARPLRIKPTDPGGMTVIGANEQVMGDGTGATGDMAPAAERPDPQALRAQRQAVSAPQADQPAAPAAAAARPDPAPTTLPTTLPTPGPTPGPASAKPRGTFVQMAAVESEGAATTEWARLAKKMPELLGDRRPVVQRAEAGGKAVWRVRTGGFADTAEAMQFCQKVRAKGGGCSIANF